MAAHRELQTMVGLITLVILAAGAYSASSVFAPLALALFIIAIVAPLQRWLQSRIPILLALGISVLIAIMACLVFASLTAWGFSQVGRSVIANSARYQALYNIAVIWLEDHDVFVAKVWAEHFNISWLLRAAQQVSGRVNTTINFWLIAFMYVILGLLELDDVRGKLCASVSPEAAQALLNGSTTTAVKLRKYLMVRTQMSVITGLLVWALTWLVGLPFAAEWGVIAFTLNYIPFIGPFIATLLPTLVAMTQFETWWAVLEIFVWLNIIQFIVGSYIEPRVSGSVLAVSPFVVLFSVFFWTFLWGLFGAFIGVPITIAILTFCAQYRSSRWVANLLGAPTPPETSKG
jgi:predicted PurR-regulated permease PerM